MKWWRRVNRLGKSANSDTLLAEFEETLMLVVDPEQLTCNLIGKLRESTPVEEAIVYLVDSEQSPEVFSRVDSGRTKAIGPPTLPLTGKTLQWFSVNREFLVFDRDREVVDYLRDELEPFIEQAVNLACPLVSMDRLIGVAFMRVARTESEQIDPAELRVLFRRASLAFENALLLKDRLRQNERMFRAEQLATMGQFAAGIAHELRNPLTAIRSTVQFVASELPDNLEHKQLIDGILNEVDRIDGIVGNLLSMARPAGRSRQEVDIAEQIRQCLSFVEAEAKNQGITLRTSFQQRLPRASFNEAELRQVLLNVIMNGFQAMPNGGTLSIAATAIGPAADRILVEIADQGSGIAPDLRQKVLEPFFTTKSGGTGLGLAVCNSIMKRYSGEIRIEQAEGGGTAVRIILPVS